MFWKRYLRWDCSWLDGEGKTVFSYVPKCSMLLSTIPSSSMKLLNSCAVLFLWFSPYTWKGKEQSISFLPAFLLIPTAILLFITDFELSFKLFSEHHFGISVILNTALRRVRDLSVRLEWCGFGSAEARKAVWTLWWIIFAPENSTRQAEAWSGLYWAWLLHRRVALLA